VRSYIVRKRDLDKVFEWSINNDLMDIGIPRSHELYRVFLGEFYWSPAFEFHNISYYHHAGWTRGSDNRIPKEVLVSADQYHQERSGYDCSIDDNIRIYLPAKWLADNMSLQWKGIEGQFFDQQGNLIAFDPSVKTTGPRALLVNRDALIRFLHDKGYDILWTVVGEKMVLNGSSSLDKRIGRLEIRGAYRILKNKIVGKITPRFSSR
jgi:hypothetical protein